MQVVDPVVLPQLCAIRPPQQVSASQTLNVHYFTTVILGLPPKTYHKHIIYIIHHSTNPDVVMTFGFGSSLPRFARGKAAWLRPASWKRITVDNSTGGGESGVSSETSWICDVTSTRLPRFTRRVGRHDFGVLFLSEARNPLFASEKLPPFQARQQPK